MAIATATSPAAALAAAKPRFRTLRPGRLGYSLAVALQERLVAARAAAGEDLLVLLEHPPVITLGRRSDPAHLLFSTTELARRGVEMAASGRGGDVTWHGPGQLVGYPIVDLAPRGRDLHAYLRDLEEVLIRTLDHFGVAGRRLPGRTGVWVGGAKIASIGIAVRRWIAWHGFALNVAADLSGFAAIVPCGLHGVRMTSLSAEAGRSVSLAEVEKVLTIAFAEVLHMDYAGDHDQPPTP